MVKLPFEPVKPAKNDTLMVTLKSDEKSDDKVISEIAKKNNCSNISTFFFWENRKKIKIVTLKFKNLEEKKSFLSEIKKIIDQKQKQK